LNSGVAPQGKEGDRDVAEAEEIERRQYETMLYLLQDQIALISRNRAEQLNAFHLLMIREIVAALDEAAQDEEVCAIMVSGNRRNLFAAAEGDKRA